MKINRNKPCPCGSGKKYKKCCLGKEGENPGLGNMQDIMAAVGRELEGGEFSSLEEAQIEHFAEFFGLAELQITPEDTHSRRYEIKKSPLLEQFISFSL